MTRSQFLAGVFVVALFTRASVTSAQHDRPSAGSQQSLWGPGAGRTSTTTSTLTQLALELRELVPERPSLFAVAELQAELSSVQAAELGKRLHQVLGSQVPGVRLRLPYPTPPIAARKRARELNLRLVLLSPQLSRSELLVTADVIEWPENVWERAKLPLGITTHHQTLSKPVDAEVRQFLPRPPKLWSKKQIFPSPSSQVLALACGTSEGQAGQQLLVVGRRKLYLGRFVGAEFRADTVAQWDELSPLSPNPLRTPVAGALFGPNAIYVGSSDRRDLLVLSANLEVLGRKPAAYPVWGPEGGLRCHEFSQTGLALASAPCSTRRPSGSTVRRKIPSTDALANGTFSDADGTTAGVAATVTGFKATLVISPPTGESLSFQTEGWGAQVALADLDGDTAIDVITSKATLHPEEDGLLLHQLTSSGLRLAAEVSTGSVSALTVCPFDGTNPQPVIAAVGREFWVLK